MNIEDTSRDEDVSEDVDGDNESFDKELQDIRLQHKLTVLQERTRKDIEAFKIETEIRSKYRGECCFCIDNVTATKAI